MARIDECPITSQHHGAYRFALRPRFVLPDIQPAWVTMPARLATPSFYTTEALSVSDVLMILCGKDFSSGFLTYRILRWRSQHRCQGVGPRRVMEPSVQSNLGGRSPPLSEKRRNREGPRTGPSSASVTESRPAAKLYGTEPAGRGMERPWHSHYASLLPMQVDMPIDLLSVTTSADLAQERVIAHVYPVRLKP